jgi:hypothetical protein
VERFGEKPITVDGVEGTQGSPPGFDDGSVSTG